MPCLKYASHTYYNELEKLVKYILFDSSGVNDTKLYTKLYFHDLVYCACILDQKIVHSPSHRPLNMIHPFILDSIRANRLPVFLYYLCANPSVLLIEEASLMELCQHIQHAFIKGCLCYLN